jgi:predicted hydrocarbon binding protein
MKDYTIEDIRRIARPTLGKDVPLELFRILRIIGMRNLLGDSSGPALYLMGKYVGSILDAKDEKDIVDMIKELRIGIPKIEKIDEAHYIVKLYECITCAGFPYTGEMFCHMESGILAGLFEKISGRKAKSTQTKSWSVGYDHCEFDIILY